MELQITAQERELLGEILQQHQRGLLLEIAHTGHREFKAALQDRARLLEALLKKLDVPEPAARRAS
jgi:hypothetical protein